MKKIVYCLMAIPLIAAMSGLATAETSTVSMVVTLDKTQTSVNGNPINIQITAVDDEGKTDTFGEVLGSDIIVAIQSQLGTVTNGNVINTRCPGGGVSGGFAASTKYLDIVSGIGGTNITYTTAPGTDALVIQLLENQQAEGGGCVSRTIDSQIFSVKVDPQPNLGKFLAITSFVATASDPNAGLNAVADTDGSEANASDNSQAQGIDGLITAAEAGGQFSVGAFIENGTISGQPTPSQAGTVTITLTGIQKDINPATPSADQIGGNLAVGNTYTLTGEMDAGVAIITIDGSVVKAGRYYVTATLGSGTEALTSDTAFRAGTDTLEVVPVAGAKLGVFVDKTVVGRFGGTNNPILCQVNLLDIHGNLTPTAAGIDVRLADSGSTGFPPTIDLGPENILAGNTNSGIFALNQAENISAGNITLTASAVGSPGIATSDPQTISVRAFGLSARLNAGPLAFTAGAIVISTDDGAATPLGLEVRQDNESPAAGDDPGDGLYQDENGLADPTQYDSALPNGTGLVVDHVAGTRLVESLSTSISQAAAPGNDSAAQFDVANLKFNKSTAAGNFVIRDTLGTYGSVTIPARPVTIGVPTTVTYINQKGDPLTALTAVTNIDGDPLFEVVLIASLFRVTDVAGNDITTGPATGTVTVSSTLGTVTGSPVAIGTGAAGGVQVDYADGVTGTDTLTFTYSVPGLAGITKMTITIPEAKKLTTIQLNVPPAESEACVDSDANTCIPINGETVIEILGLDDDGNGFNTTIGGTQLLLTYPEGVIIYKANRTVPYGNASARLDGSANGREILSLQASNKATLVPDGSPYIIKVADATGKIAAEITVDVAPGIPAPTCTNPSVSISGPSDLDCPETGSYTASTQCDSGNPETPIYKWELDGAAAGTGNTVTVECTANGTKTLKVTDTANGNITDTLTITCCPAPPCTIEVEQDQIARNSFIPLPAILNVSAVGAGCGDCVKLLSMVQIESEPLSVLKLAALRIPPQNNIIQFVLVLPSILTGITEDETITVGISDCTDDTDDVIIDVK